MNEFSRFQSSKITSAAVRFVIKRLKTMPKATSTNIKNKQVTEDLISSPELSYEVPVENELKAHTNSENKISFCETDSKSGEGDCTVDANINIDFRSDLRKMLDAFGTDINEALQAKKQRLEQYGAGKYKNHSCMKSTGLN